MRIDNINSSLCKILYGALYEQNMKKSELPTIFASIAASYARRELDRSVYDRLMATRLGERLVGLDKMSKYALEFIAYSVTAFATRPRTDADAIRTFINNVAADAPAEIAKRAINGAPKIYPNQIKSFLADMSDDQLSMLIEDMRTIEVSPESSFSNQSTSEGDNPSALSALAENIEKSSRRIRERRGKRP